MEELLQFLNQIYPLPTALMEELSPMIKRRLLHEKEYLLSAGEVCGNIYFIRKGMLRCYYLRDTKEVSAWFMKETDTIVSVESFYDQIPSYEFIQALEDCELYYISFAQLEEIYSKYLEFNVVGRILTTRYLKMWTRQLRYLRSLSALERYQELLAKEPELLLRVPLKLLASYLDMEPETLSRMRGLGN
jgi:CRP/FNR family transcriptional regulator, anaerobic regulatory protein